MTEANPFRSDELAAQERVVQLERELAKKNELIYKLRYPEPKKPRTPINWSRLPVRTLKIIGICACVGGLFYTCGPNSLYTSDGIISYVSLARTETICFGPTKIVFEKGEAKTQNTGCHTYIDYDIRASYLDVNGKMRETFAKAFETDNWFNNDTLPKSENAKFGNKRIVYPKNMNHLKKGCVVKVYFLRSVLLKTRPWAQDPKIDASMCGE